MKKSIQTIVYGIGVFVIIFICSCAKDMKPFEMGNNQNPKKVLVLAADSSFKKQVLDKTIEKLGTKDWYFRVIGFEQFKSEDATQFGAILVVCELVAGHLQSKANSILEKYQTDPRMIIFLTKGSDDLLKENAKKDIGSLDAVTSASASDRVESTADQIATFLMKRFN